MASTFSVFVGGECGCHPRSRIPSIQVLPLVSCSKNMAGKLPKLSGCETEFKLILARSACTFPNTKHHPGNDHVPRTVNACVILCSWGTFGAWLQTRSQALSPLLPLSLQGWKRRRRRRRQGPTNIFDKTCPWASGMSKSLAQQNELVVPLNNGRGQAIHWTVAKSIHITV